MKALRRYILRLLTIILAITFPHAKCGAEFFCRINNFSTDNGLVQARLSNAVIDRMGFLWFATWNGLVRFDGYSFFTFKPILNSDGTIFSNRIYNLKANSAGNIWCISSNNKLNCFNTTTNRFSDAEKYIKEIRGKRVKTITTKKHDASWVVFKDGSCLRLTDNNWEYDYVFLNSNSRILKGCKAEGVKYDSYGNEWIITDKKTINFTTGICVNGRYKHIVCSNNTTYLISVEGHIAAIKKDQTIKKWKLTRYKINTEYAETVGNNMIAIATDKGIFAFDTKKQKPIVTNLSIKGNESIKYLYADKKDRLWAFSDTGVMLADLKSKNIKILKTQPSTSAGKIKNPQLIFEDSRNNLFVKPPLGILSYFDEQTQSLKELEFYENNRQQTPQMKNLKKFLTDRYGNLWLLGEHKTTCITFHEKLFVHDNNYSNNETKALYDDMNGTLWSGDKAGNIILKNKQNGNIAYLRQDGSVSAEPEQICNSPIHCIKKDNKQRIWVGTKGNGVFILTPTSLHGRTHYRITHLTHDKSKKGSLCSDSIYDICHDSKGNVWLGSYGQGLIHGLETPEGWIFHKYRGTHSTDRIRCIIEAKPGILLIGTTTGLVTADVRKKYIALFYTNKYRKDKNGLKGNDIMSIIKAGKKIYVCVYGSGVSEIAQENLLSCHIKFNNYMMPTSATADQITTATTTGRNIYIVSEKAISMFNTLSKTFRIYDSSNFIGDFNLSEAKPVVADGYITIGTSCGTMTFPDKLEAYIKKPADIVFTGIQYQNDMNMKPLNDITQLTIMPQERSFSLYVSSPNITGISDTRYRYMLKGYDRSWNYTENGQHSINYSNLTPGEYELDVEATTGTWGDEKARKSIQVKVVPLFTETIWFKLSLIAFVVCVIVAMAFAIAYLNRMRHIIQHKYSLLMAIDSVKMKKQPQATINKESEDMTFITKLTEVITEHIDESRMPVEELARNFNMSRTAFYNKMKETTGLSPSDFIKQIRIRQALRIIDSENISITEVAYRTGFSDPKYFAKCFKAEMGMTPTQYITERKSNSRKG
jgi:AraC-like DNA-binding protein/ligand-binding sensor domain-containing protein